MCMFPLIALGGMIITKSLQEGARKNRQAYEQAGGIAEEVLYKIKTVASFANFKYEKERFEEKLELSYQAGKGDAWKMGVGTGLIFLAIYSTYCLAIWYGSTLISEEKYNDNKARKFQVGDVITCMFSIIFGSMSLGQVAPSIKVINEACVAACDLFELKQRVPKMDYSNSTKKPNRDDILGKIRFKNVQFNYDLYSDINMDEINKKIVKDEKIKLLSKGKNLFEDLNFEILPGQKTAFVGKSGCGKSTIVNLIERLYDVTGGEILIDGMNIKELEILHFRSMIGYVPQEPVLFNTSVRENIIFGRQNITDDQIKEACEKANAHFIFKNPEGLDFIVGIKGSKLSGGEKQRIAIARAILLKPKILILDEATSALDNESEKVVQEALDKVSQGITTIIIAHRLSTIINSDQIFLIHDGLVAETGTHKELLAKDGKYSRLVKNQINTIDEQKFELPEGSKAENYHKHAAPVEEIKDDKKDDYKEVLIKKEKQEQRVKSIKKKLLPILKENICVLIWATFFSCCVGCVWPVYGLLMAESLSALADRSLSVVRENGFTLAMYFLLLAGCAGIAQFFQNYLFVLQGEFLTKRLRSIVFEKFLRLDIAYYDNKENTPGSLLTKLSSDTTKINGIALSMVSIVFQTICTVVLGVALALAFYWKIALINMGFLPIIILTFALQWRLRQGFNSKDEYLESKAGGILSESVCNTKTIFSYNMQGKVVDMYINILTSKDKDNFKSTLFTGLLFGLSQCILLLDYATLFYAGAKFMSDGDTNVKLSDFLKSMFCIIFAGIGLGQAQQYVGDMESAKKALLNIFNTIETESKIDPMVPRHNAISADNLKGKIEFRNVYFSYPTKPDVLVLKGLSFVIEAGQSAAFVGKSGCGKSSVIQLLERFYDVDEGEILIDDINIKDYDLVSLRKRVSLVMQEPVLFNEDIIKNVNYGDLTKGIHEVREATKIANISELMSSDYDQKVIPVSGGQKQRLAIARAMIRDPKILLLDEATSALDKTNEEAVQKTLNEVMKGRTSISIAHRYNKF